MRHPNFVLLILADKPFNDVVRLQFIRVVNHVIGVHLVQISELVV